MPQTTLNGVEVDIYKFIANDYKDAYPVAEYKDWYCDFFVSTDRPIDDGIILVGNYSDYGWLGFWAPASDEAYEPTGLLGAVSHGGNSNLTYEGVVNDVQIFQCGVIDYLGNNTGVQVTVQLRMTNPSDSLDIITVRSITVTL